MKRQNKDAWQHTAYQSKKKVNEQFGNRKLFWKEVRNVKGGELQQNEGLKWQVGTSRG